MPQGLAKSDWASIRAAYEAGRHAFQPVAGQDGVWQARNPGQQWLTKFDGRGFVAEPKGGGWQWGLELKRYGFPGTELVLSGVATVKAEGQRLTYGWDAAATTASGLTGDDQAVAVNIGFAFNFYGTSYTAVNICSNGFLNFGTSSTAYTPAAIPNAAAPNALIAGVWRDLNVSGGGTITYYSSATKFVVSFNAVKNYSNTSTQTFQMILTPDGKIKLQWGSITTAETYVSGVENQTGAPSTTT